tara:strand:+ start:743 stop:1576 length:834 start_codon:yes stop_codon:yes gene_type:complete
MNYLSRFLLLIPLFIASDEILDSVEISYGDNTKQAIDFYKGSSDKVLIWIHGGGWLYGDKRSERWIRRFQNHFVEHEDFNVFMIGYRIGEASAPYAVNDVICAYDRIIREIEFRGLSMDDIIVAGASAGGHLALMVGYSENYKDKKCNPKQSPKAVINLFGITEIENTYKFLDKTKFFKASNYVRRWIPEDVSISEASINLSPMNMITTKDGPEVLTIHGTNDRWVPYEQAQLLEKKLNKKHHLLTIEGGGHYYFSDDEDNLIRNKISAFISKNIKD